LVDGLGDGALIEAPHEDLDFLRTTSFGLLQVGGRRGGGGLGETRVWGGGGTGERRAGERGGPLLGVREAGNGGLGAVRRLGEQWLGELGLEIGRGMAGDGLLGQAGWSCKCFAAELNFAAAIPAV